MYNFLQHYLHDILLSNKFLKKTLFEIECLLMKKKINTNINKEKHIFITGLPRSGSTAILNYFFKTKQFASLTYENMPFIMSPNIFSNLIFFKKNNILKKKRLHNDGIYHDLKSPEAFDEIFFSTFNTNELKKKFSKYVSLICYLNKKKRYLSKNNLNYRRIKSIQKIFPNSFFLIPIRNPIDQSHSLLEQHKLFSIYQQKNNFTLRYMQYLGHNEFGINHKPWNHPQNFKSSKDINYWLEQWILFYENLYKKYKNKKNCLFISYEKLNNKKYINYINRKCDLIRIKSNLKVTKKNIIFSFNNQLLNKANIIYQKIIQSKN